MDWYYRLDNPVKKYAWGCPDVLPKLLGAPNPEREPWAELWIGAHPSAPSRLPVLGGCPLDAWLRDNSDEALGPDISATYDRQLPFLLKFLAIRSPLSLQIHPPAAEAACGFADEEARGVPKDDTKRCFHDPRAKPELIVALSRFEALSGFLGDARCNELWEPLDSALASPLAGESAPSRLTSLMTLDARERRAFCTTLRGVCEERSGLDPAYRLVGELAKRYPDDPGSAAPLLLQHHRLTPGQALFLEPGHIHAYLEGTGIEIMASSDNVLRAGLTEKLIRTDLLLKSLSTSTRKQNIILPIETSPGRSAYKTPAEAFRLERIEPGNVGALELPASEGPEFLLVVEGEVVLRNGAREARTVAGEAVFLPACRPDLTIIGKGVAFRAFVGTHTKDSVNR